MSLPPLDERPGPAKPISADAATSAIDAALDRAARRRVIRPKSWWRQRVVLGVAAALVLLGAFALAASSLRSPTVTPVASEHVEIAPPPATTAAPPPLATTNEPVVDEPAPTTSATPPKEPPASDLLREANDLRTKHRWTEAEATYQRVIARAPHGEEAYTAEVAAASIRLEHLHDPKGALRLDETALAEHPNGALSEEASYGVAEAKHALGDTRGEAAALRAFIAAHPDSLTRSVAERRLSEIADAAP